MSAARRPSGWYRDPDTRRQQRFWDGRAWTELRREPPPGPTVRQRWADRRERWTEGATRRRRRRNQVLALVAVLALLAGLIWWLTSDQREELRGGERGEGHTASAVVPVVGVSDGDTLRVTVNGATERLRIIGMDAPELSERECYAQAAASRMQSLVQSRDVRIAADPTQGDRDRYGRLLRHVYTLDGTNVAEALIAEGLAVEYTYSRHYDGRDDYLAAQDTAREESLGLWSGECDVEPLEAPNG